MDMLDQEHVINDEELLMIYGGASLSGTVVNAFTYTFKTFYGFGQDFGGAIRRIITKKLCNF